MTWLRDNTWPLVGGVLSVVWIAAICLYLGAGPVLKDFVTSSWPGLSRPSTSLTVEGKQDVDARDKRGHDEAKDQAEKPSSGQHSFRTLLDSPPNNFGDFLAGVFAPLAFLWLFIATMLQREELKEQRKDLEETREAMAQQKAEMERAADASISQAMIMNETLALERDRAAFNEFDIELYSVGLYVVANKYKLGFDYEALKQLPHVIDRNNYEIVFIIYNSVIDRTTDFTSEEVKILRNKLLNICIDRKFSSNLLVIRRIESLGVDEIRRTIERLI